MPAKQSFVTVPHRILSRGIDQRSAPNNIPIGYCELMKNLETISQGFVSKRKGYQGYHGFLPIRVASFDKDGTTGTFVFDSKISLLLPTPSPIVVYGAINADGTGTISSTGTAVTGVGTAFSTELKVGSQITAGGETHTVQSIASDTSLTLKTAWLTDQSGAAWTHRTPSEYKWDIFENTSRKTLAAGSSYTLDVDFNIGTSDTLLGVAEAPSSSSLDNNQVYPEELRIISDEAAEVDLDLTYDSGSRLFYFYNEDPDLTDVVPYNHSFSVVPSGSTATVTIPAATHLLPNLQLVAATYFSDSTYLPLRQVFADSFEIDSATGDLILTFENVAASDLDGGSLYGKVILRDMPASRSQEQTVAAGTGKTIVFSGVSNPFNFTSLWLRDAGGDRYQVLPDAISYDATAETLTFTVDIAFDGILVANYMPGLLASNKVSVDLTDYPKLIDDSIPAADLYGILHTDLGYRSNTTGGSNVNVLAQYFSEGTNTVVAGLGGILYEEVTSGGMSFPIYQSSMHRRVAVGRTIGPFFGASASMSRGITATNIVDRMAIVTSITNNGDATATIALSLPGKTGLLSDLITTISTTGNDRVTLTNVHNEEYEGTFDITATDDGANTITISIPDLADYVPSQSGLDARAGIYTDFVMMNLEDDDTAADTALPFLINDIINSSLFENFSPVVIGVDTSVAPIADKRLFLGSITEESTVPPSARFAADRTSDVLMLDGTDCIVRGDMLAISDYGRKFRVLSIDTSANSVTIDESIAVQDLSFEATTVQVSGRWQAVEGPIFNGTRFQYWDQNEYASQPRSRAAASKESIFFTNYDDQVMKYDGATTYRAGLPNWQPRTHSWVVPNDESGIILPKIRFRKSEDASGDTKLFFPTILPEASDELYIYDNDDLTAGVYDVIERDNTANTITINHTWAANAGKPGDVSIPQQVAYYFKIAMIDRNNGLVASAVTDYQECVVNINQNSQIVHRLTGLPKFDTYDYDRIYIEVYRTKVDTIVEPIFYRVQRVSMDFETVRANNAITVVDRRADVTLPDDGDDFVSIALKGAELPLLSTQPPRAKYIHSADNRIVLGNLTSYNTLDLTLISDSGITKDNTLDGTVVAISDGTNTDSYEYLPFLSGSDLGSDYEVVSAIDRSAANSLSFTVGSTAGMTAGDYIQVVSFLVDGTVGTDVSDGAGQTRDDDYGRVIGWWKIKSVDSGTELTIDYTAHGLTADYSNASSYPLYVGHKSGVVPIASVPYALTVTGTIVNNIVYDDTQNNITNTEAVTRGIRDLRNAFNRVMIDKTAPWGMAQAGVTEGSGRILFEAADPNITISVSVTTGGSSDTVIFINNVRTPSGQTIDGISRVFPSRVLLSAQLYPEMFDNPYTDRESFSDSVINVNEDDGQEITGITSFFSQSTQSAGQNEDQLIIFKTNSIYVLSINQRTVNKLESMGQGCTVPDSIRSTKDGIMFANESGLYRINRQLSVEYIGKQVERYWQNTVNHAQLEQATGYTDYLTRNYKLSIPTTTDQNNEVIVFDYIVEPGESGGAWSLHDNIPATAWTQTKDATFFSTYDGQVFSLRDQNDETDFRDDTDGISALFQYAPTSFDDGGTRTVVNRVISHFTVNTDLTDAKLNVATDLSETFTNVATFNFSKSDGNKLESLAASMAERHSLFTQLQYTHSTKDEDFALSGIDYKVTTLTEEGIKQANE